MDKKVNELAKYRLDRAKETLNTAKAIFELGDYISANNRAQYSIFYAMRSVLAIERKNFKKHKDVIAYFNKNYINTEKFSKKLGHKIAIAQKQREDADYDDNYQISPEKVDNQIKTAEELINLVEDYFNNSEV